MSLTFADTHNMVAYLNKSDASEGFNQVIDFLNGSFIKYALTSNDVTRLQALVDRKKVVITEAAIKDVLRLDDAEGVNCLPNKEIFSELARMGYEKPSTKLTFYKAFFSCKWKFLIHTILQTMSAKRTSWNEFSSAMASAVICLSTGDLSTHSTKYTFPALTQKVFANMRRVGKGFLGVEMPLFEGMIVAREPEEQGDAEEQVQDNVDDVAQGVDTAVSGDDVQDQSILLPTPPTPPHQQPQDLPSTSQVQHNPPQSPSPQPQSPPLAQPQAADFPMSLLHEALDACAALTRRVEHLEHDKVAQDLEITKLKTRMKKLERANKERMIADLDRDTGVVLMNDEGIEKKAEDAQVGGDDQVQGRQAEIYQIDMDHASKVLIMQEDKPEVQEVVKVVTTAKLIIEVVAAVSESVTAASATIAAVPAATIIVAPVRVAAASTRRRKGVVIKDPKEESTAIIPVETKSKDKGKGIMVEDPKPMKKKQQVELDEEYARKLHEELNKNIDWDVAIDHVKQKAKEDSYVQRYQVMKKRPQTEAQAQRIMIMYLKNVAGFRLVYFKGMYYDDIRPIFEAKFNSNIEFLLKKKEQLEEEENRAIESINETPAQKAAKKRKLNEEVGDLKQHLEIVPDKDDDVYTEATPLARKVSVVDYHIIQLNNKPHYKIIRADGTHQLYVSFITLLKNFDREDLESLWSIVKERFFKSKPNNFSDNYLLTTLRAMFGRPDGQDQLILPVERRYPLSRFTLDQKLNEVRLRVENRSEMSLELLRFTRQQHQEGQHE
nr:hypothetical protein [Tanacetum cinerariifolium]